MNWSGRYRSRNATFDIRPALKGGISSELTQGSPRPLASSRRLSTRGLHKRPRRARPQKMIDRRDKIGVLLEAVADAQEIARPLPAIGMDRVAGRSESWLVYWGRTASSNPLEHASLCSTWRRNGRPAWMGNGLIEDAVLPDLLARGVGRPFGRTRHVLDPQAPHVQLRRYRWFIVRSLP